MIEAIGAGAMGAVYRAEQVELGRSVALKVLSAGARSQSDVAARFQREAQAMSALTHPNTVRVYDFGATEDGKFFVAMELLEGEAASKRLERAPLIGVREAIDWSRQVLRSLAEAHQKGIIHRDVKPDNLYLAQEPHRSEPLVKVLDFGIAKAVAGEHAIDQFETLDGTVFGTPRYMSPEQAQGRPLDPRSDLYAVGIVLYELLAGSPPFVDSDAVVVMAKHIRDQAPPITHSQSGELLSSRLQKVVTRALAKDPAERFQSAEEFEQALLTCQREQTLRLQPLLEFGTRLGRDRKMLTLSALALSGFAAAAFGLSSAWPTESSDRAADTALAADAPGSKATAAAAPPAAQTPTSAEVLVQSEPQGASIVHAGRTLGETPLRVEVPEGEALRLELDHEGYQPLTLDLTSGEEERMVRLEPLPSEPVPNEQASAEVKRRPRRKRSVRSRPTSSPGESRDDSPYEKF
ncbi:MAG: protein kinase [Myxococcales bacterium]|nr:protein kinase [Myxococcales bacterium]